MRCRWQAKHVIYALCRFQANAPTALSARAIDQEIHLKWFSVLAVWSAAASADTRHRIGDLSSGFDVWRPRKPIEGVNLAVWHRTRE